MTTNVSFNIGAEPGSSPLLRQWLQALSGPAAGIRPEAIAAADPALAARRPTAAGASGEPPTLTGAEAEVHEVVLSAQSLSAHAAAGELEVRRQTYATLERAWSGPAPTAAASSVETLEESARRRRERHRAERAHGAQIAADRAEVVRAGERAVQARAARSTEVGGATGTAAGAEPVEVTATREAARGLAQTTDRLVELRREASAAVRATAARVAALSEQIASADRRERMAARRADEVQERRIEAQRDAAARELARLTGASVQQTAEGTLRVQLGSRPLVDETGSHALRIRQDEGTPAELDADQSVPGRDRERGEAAREPGRAADARDGLPADEAAEPTERPEELPLRALREALARIDADASAQPSADVDRSPEGPSRAADLRLDAAAVAESSPAQRTVVEWADGTPVDGLAGVLAGQRAAVDTVLAQAHRQWQAVVADVAAGVQALAVGSSSVAAAELHALAAALGADPGQEPTADAEQLLGHARAAMAALRSETGAASLTTQRRLDVLDVVDGVLAGGPSPQAGRLVSAALGAVAGTAPGDPWRVSASGQHLVSSLQAINALTVSMGTTAALAAALGPTPVTVTTSGSPVVVATSSTPTSADAAASATGAGGWPRPTGRGVALSLHAVAALSGEASGGDAGAASETGAAAGAEAAGADAAGGLAPETALGAPSMGGGPQRTETAPPSLATTEVTDVVGSVAGEPLAPGSGSASGEAGDASVAGVASGPADEAVWAGPGSAYQAEVSVVSVAAAGTIATATLAPGAILNAGRGFSFAVVTQAGGPDARSTPVSVGPGSRLADVAAAIGASGAPVWAAVEGVSTPAGLGQRLVLRAGETGAASRVALVDGLGSTRPSALGATVTLQTAADSVVDVRFEDGAGVRVRGRTTSLPGALPGIDLALRVARSAGLAGAAAAPAASPDAALTAQVRATPDTAAAMRRVEVLVGAAAAVLDAVAGRAGLDPAAAEALAGDPAITDLSTRIASALGLSGSAAGANAASGLSGALSGALSGVLAARGVDGSPGGLPGVRPDAHGRLAVHAAEFARGYESDPATVETRVHAAARELAAVAKEASDPRTGVLPVRILGEQDHVREYTVTGASVDERMHYRQEALQRRTEAMSSLLVRLGQEHDWLGAQLS